MAGAAERFGFGPQRGRMAGAPHMEEVTFRGEFPLAHLEFACAAFPGAVAMTAFNPFIPLNDRDSSIPAAFFEIRVRNTDRRGGALHRGHVAVQPGAAGRQPQRLRSGRRPGGRPGGPQAEPHRGGGGRLGPRRPVRGHRCRRLGRGGVGTGILVPRRLFDCLEVYWREFAAPGQMPERRYRHGAAATGRVRFEVGDTGTLGASFDVEPGAERSVRFVISWSFPNFAKYWASGAEREAPATPPTWKNYYATLFEDSAASARYALRHWDRLYGETLRFKEALYGSTLPPAALEAAAANLAVLKTPTCLRLTDGSFYGFEGLRPEEGCCEGSCTHVWNYAYALPFLFPKLERSMRDLDFTHNQRPDGGMGFRLRLPLGAERTPFRPCADGQFGGVIKTYRDWKICGDSDWLRRHWPAVKKSIEFAWAESNEDRWDADRDGVLEGRQHHTLDMELFGPNSWLTGFYLGALKAGAEMAEHLGEAETAGEYRRLFQRGRRWVDEHLFNGSWYHQQIDVRDRSILERYLASDPDVVATYWNEEAGEIKYQIAEGSEIDQLNAQWHANLCGLGDLFDPEQRRTALRSLYRNNFKSSMRDFFNACRIYCMNGKGAW